MTLIEVFVVEVQTKVQKNIPDSSISTIYQYLYIIVKQPDVAGYCPLLAGSRDPGAENTSERPPIFLLGHQQSASKRTTIAEKMDDDVASRAQDESLLERPSSTTPPFNLIPPSNDPSTTSSEETYSPDAVGVATGSQSPVKDMEPETSGHRRRRSSLLNNLDTNIQTKTKKSPVSGGSGHLSIPDGKARDGSSEDESRSTSDDVELEDLSDEDLHDDEETGLTKKDKKRKKRRRRRNTLLNQRVAAEVKLTEMEKRDALRNVVKRLLINGSLIALWYTFSLSISLVRAALSPSTKSDHFLVQQMDVRSQASEF